MKIKILGFSALALLLLTACSSKEKPVVEKEKPKPCIKQCCTKIYIKSGKSSVKHSTESQGQLYYPKVIYTKPTSVNTETISIVVQKLVEQLEKNNTIANLKEFPMMVVPFSSTDNVKQDEKFSGVLHEKFLHELQVKTYQVLENKTKNEQAKPIEYKVSGSYMPLEKGMLVNAKIINQKTNVIISSAQVLIPTRELKKL